MTAGTSSIPPRIVELDGWRGALAFLALQVRFIPHLKWELAFALTLLVGMPLIVFVATLIQVLVEAPGMRLGKMLSRRLNAKTTTLMSVGC